MPENARDYVIMTRASMAADPVSQRVWFVEDEVGAAVHASDDPSAYASVFVFLSRGQAFTVMFLTRPLDTGDTVTRAEQPASEHVGDWASV